ncbi:MAG: AMP-binding protein [Deltaproteobacteria bacterium]|nr:AMP-binding protein [Deltaproteobacteria bacterium]
MSMELQLSKQLVMGEMLARWARQTPDAEALVFNDRRYSYGRFNERVNRLANSLMSLGVQKGNKVTLIFMNCMEIAESYLALAKIGAVAVLYLSWGRWNAGNPGLPRSDPKRRPD